MESACISPLWLNENFCEVTVDVIEHMNGPNAWGT
jgi:hypothetical protein